MDFLYEPQETNDDPYDLKPLEWDDEEYEDEDNGFGDGYDDGQYAEDEFEEPGLGGFDDLKPFGSFSDGFGWDDGFI